MLRGILVVGGGAALAIAGALNVAAVPLAVGPGEGSPPPPATPTTPSINDVPVTTSSSAVTSGSGTVTSGNGTVNVAPGSVSIDAENGTGSVKVDASGVSIRR